MIWLIILSPLVGAILNGLLLPRRTPLLSHVVACLALAVAFAGSCMTFWQMMTVAGGEPTYYLAFDWIKAGKLSVPFEFVVDRLSALMLLIITGIGTLIHIYAGGYMHEEETTYRFFSYLNLFVFMMLLLVLGNNMLVMFVGWEGVGLCSYLLIGYWYQDDKNAAAGMKAFLVNRIGDIGFLVGIFLTFKYFGTLSFSELKQLVLAGLTPEQTAAITGITLCFFVGACGKSAQLPLYVWLPDAMAGPTPVSALIHAATMVTAGIYMMTRMSYFYYLAPTTLAVVAWVGVLTAVFAATIALVQTDIKKVLAYSTVSQLGYMVLACGVGAFDAGVFHLLTHACFKALLFLGAGSVIVAMHHKQDMREMGGLRQYLPMTHAVMLVGVLAIIGFPGLAGFFSKDEILWKAFIFPGFGPYLWAVGVVAAACTAFYMVRLLCLTFYGPNRSDKHTREHLHETPVHMWGPLVVLALLSAGVGYLGVPALIGDMLGLPNFFANYLTPALAMPEAAAEHWAFLQEHHSHSLEWGLMGFSVVVALSSAALAVSMYSRGPSPLAGRLYERFASAHRTLTNKYWVDELYDRIFVKPLSEVSDFLWRIVDVKGINGFINGLAAIVMGSSGFTSFNMTGSIARHGMAMVLGMVLLLVVIFSV